MNFTIFSNVDGKTIARARVDGISAQVTVPDSLQPGEAREHWVAATLHNRLNANGANGDHYQTICNKLK